MPNEAGAGGGRRTIGQDEALALLRRFFPFIVLIAVCIGFALIANSFLTVRNLETVLRQAAVLSIAAMGGTFIILMGSVDLSVGSVTGLSAVLTAVGITLAGPSGLLLGFAAAVALMAMVGVICGQIKVPSFIVTLGLLVAGHGLILLITNGRPILIRDSFMREIGSGDVYGIPYIVMIAVLAYAIAHIIHYHTVLGRSIVAIGGGEEVAKRSGIPVERIKVQAFTLAGCFSGLAGIVLALRMGAGSPTAGTSLELDVIAAVVLGGTPLTGGNGGPAGTIVGALIIAVLSNGLNLAGVSSYTQMVIKGTILVLAVMITIDRQKIGIIK